MPYCTKCGSEVQDADVYCSKCGQRQGAPGPQARDPFARVSRRKAAILCYIPFVGWLAAIVVLASSRFRQDRTVRFHAFQGLYLFVGWLLIEWAFKWMLFGPARHIPVVPLLQFGIIAIWVFMMIKTSHDEVYSLPVVGELAERSLAEW